MRAPPSFVVIFQLFSCVRLSVTPWMQHTKLPCPPSSWSLLKLMSIESVMPSNHLILCHPLLFLPQSFPASGSFQMSQLFASDGLRIGASASTSVLPMNIKGWFPLGLTGLISLQSKGLSRVFSNTTVLKHQFFSAQPSLWSNSHIHTWLLEKPSSWPHLNLIAPQRSHFQILSSWGLGFQYMNFEEPQILSPSQNPVDLRQHQDSLIYQCPYFWSTTATTISYCYLLLV